MELFHLNVLSQSGSRHTYGISPVWRRMCTFKLCRRENCDPHPATLHSYRFSSAPAPPPPLPPPFTPATVNDRGCAASSPPTTSLDADDEPAPGAFLDDACPEAAVVASTLSVSADGSPTRRAATAAVSAAVVPTTDPAAGNASDSARVRAIELSPPDDDTAFDDDAPPPTLGLLGVERDPIGSLWPIRCAYAPLIADAGL
mmetsp:Transcript_11410/g.24593  ORF Transcript_11410/g.24593 Transcript_11410/m.24593 type:complete len:201 (-) Transcript_11410:724-1326(-)